MIPGVIKIAKRKKTPEIRLRECAEILCEAAYRMCEKSFGKKCEAPEPKFLKEACGAVKEAASVYALTVNDSERQGDEIVIRFEQSAESCSD